MFHRDDGSKHQKSSVLSLPVGVAKQTTDPLLFFGFFCLFVFNFCIASFKLYPSNVHISTLLRSPHKGKIPFSFQLGKQLHLVFVERRR